MLGKGQEGHVRAEKDLLAAAATAADSTSRWIVKLHYSFQVNSPPLKRWAIMSLTGASFVL